MATEGFAYDDVYRRIAIVATGREDVTPEVVFFAERHSSCMTDYFQKHWNKDCESEGISRISLSKDQWDKLDDLLHFRNRAQDILGRYQVLSYAGPDMRHGIYDHFKGGVYVSLDATPWAGEDNWHVVRYLSINYGTPHTRFAHEWNEVVQWPDGAYRSRFIYRGPDLRTPPPSFKVAKEALP